ncbi:MAG: hypothetical protein M0R03_08660 [Novosphingobium sp.]|nr:hypothetical protein [Novosphingobium sp.]
MKYYLSIRLENLESKSAENIYLVKNIEYKKAKNIVLYIKRILTLFKQIKEEDLL